MLYKPTIGLEIHAELRTKTKLFCDSPNNPDETRPNVNICPICMGHPGTLPVINKEAIRHVLKVGLAIGGEIADFTEFDRKNYFYPDIPKGYQISQYKYPLVSGGNLKGVAVTRVHLEEDTARSTHDKGSYSLVDFNRAGVPLMELVTEPVIENAQQAVAFARELQLLLRYLEAGEANMEKGEMRIEANVSVSKDETKGTKVEVKNLNSFKTVERAIEFEIVRQAEILERGEKIIQETRGWDETKQKTYSQRQKEDSHDYRYFPEPDLPKFSITEIPEFDAKILKEELPELPWEKRERFLAVSGITYENVEIFVQQEVFSRLLDSVVEHAEGDKESIKLAVNYLTSDLLGLENSEKEGSLEQVDPKNFLALVSMARNGEISSRGAKDILGAMYTAGGNPKKLAEDLDLFQKSSKEELEKVAREVIRSNEKVVQDYREGKETALQYLVGQGMKITKGSANPAVFKELLKHLLKS